MATKYPSEAGSAATPSSNQSANIVHRSSSLLRNQLGPRSSDSKRVRLASQQLAGLSLTILLTAPPPTAFDVRVVDKIQSNRFDGWGLTDGDLVAAFEASQLDRSVGIRGQRLVSSDTFGGSPPKHVRPVDRLASSRMSNCLINFAPTYHPSKLLIHPAGNLPVGRLHQGHVLLVALDGR